MAIAIFGAQQTQGDPGAAPWAYGLTAAIGLACFALYRWRRSAVLLVAGAALLLSGGLGLGMWRRGATS